MNLTKARIHVIFHQPGIRRTIRDVLRAIGCEDLVLGKTFDDIRIALTENSPDLMVLGASFPDHDLPALINAMRHNKVGKDPFLPIIAITTEATEHLVGNISESGFDDLLIYPLSQGELRKRLDVIIEKRKMFVVTRSYVGPDRRKANSYREGQSDIPLIKVPNALRATVTGEMNKQEMAAAIQSSLETVNGQRLGRCGEQIAWLIDRILAGYESDTDGILEPKVAEFLGELVKVGEETIGRLTGTGFEHVSYLCETVVSVAKRMAAAGWNADETDKELLPELASAFKTAFTSSDDGDVAKKIRDTLSKSAGTAPAAAKSATTKSTTAKPVQSSRKLAATG